MKKHHLSIVGILFLGYFITILIGTILLLLPISKNITEKIEWYVCRNICYLCNWINTIPYH